MTPNLICAIVFVCLAFLFVITEICTVELVSIWFVAGSLCAFILARIPQVPYYVSIIVFFLVSLLRLFLLRPLAKKYSPHKRSFNSEGRIGKELIRKKGVGKEGLGEVKVNDVTYNAKSATGNRIPLGSKVIVKAIQGNTLIVEEEKKEG